ncbi:hypothetical protein G7Z17_g6986 [Cylindrodendrum hubeiense]|uniref:Uncharacterized protein n=1 Tax=Cylindrodendrum hubeiense TaxID=595255 RepID=A0A9P5L7R9_9HYPO|nr:hypothetical protein G7Z17_g6986 [Cylindrodendrum hubeiense]
MFDSMYAESNGADPATTSSTTSKFFATAAVSTALCVYKDGYFAGLDCAEAIRGALFKLRTILRFWLRRIQNEGSPDTHASSVSAGQHTSSSPRPGPEQQTIQTPDSRTPQHGAAAFVICYPLTNAVLYPDETANLKKWTKASIAGSAIGYDLKDMT